MGTLGPPCCASAAPQRSASAARGSQRAPAAGTLAAMTPRSERGGGKRGRKEGRERVNGSCVGGC